MKRFGAHESISGGIYNAISRGVTATCDTIQMFNKSNSQWAAKALVKKEMDQYFKAIDDTGVTVSTSHTCYLINMASPDEELATKSFNALKVEMERCHLLKIPNLVMHPGAHVGTGEEAGIERIATRLTRLFQELGDENSVHLLLETTAGQGSTLGYSFEQIGEMIKKVSIDHHLGVCLDTCHIHAAGYELADPSGYDETIRKFDSSIGLDRLRIIHMNDSKHPKGSRKDRHEHIGKGHIGLEAFRHIVNDKRLAKVPLILETNKDEETLAEDIENLRVLRSLVA
jgi:deoxyribonuclease-4